MKYRLRRADTDTPMTASAEPRRHATFACFHALRAFFRCFAAPPAAVAADIIFAFASATIFFLAFAFATPHAEYFNISIETQQTALHEYNMASGTPAGISFSPRAATSLLLRRCRAMLLTAAAQIFRHEAMPFRVFRAVTRRVAFAAFQLSRHACRRLSRHFRADMPLRAR